MQWRRCVRTCTSTAPSPPSRHDDIVRESVGHEGPGPNPVNPVWVSVMGVDPEGDFFESIVDEQIIEAIDTPPEEYRTAVVLSDLEGLPYAEIAEWLDVAGRAGGEAAASTWPWFCINSAR